jgi:cell division septation protein DedD
MGSAAGTATPRYSVLVASFRHEAEAAALSGQLEGLGYRVRTVRAGSVQRGTWHQVMVGPYARPDEARQNEARVRGLPGYADAYLVRR